MKINDCYSLMEQDKSREIGIEVEVEGNNLIQELSYWHVKGDGSLRGEGIEYVTKNPIKEELVKHRLNYLYNLLNDRSNLELSDRCGVHIHVNCQHLEMDKVFKLIDRL